MSLNVLIAQSARKGAEIKNLGKMCNTCAFRLNSEANLEPHNVEAAADCLAHYGTFNCHVKPGVDAGRPCVGFLYAKQHFDHLEEKHKDDEI